MSAINQSKAGGTHHCNVASCFVCVWNLSLTSRIQNGLRLIDNRVLRKVFGPKRAEVTEHWRKLLSEELQGLYSSRNHIIFGWSTRVGWMGGTRGIYETNVYGVLVEKPDRMRPLGRPRCRWNYIKLWGWEGVDRWRAVVHTVANLWSA